MARQVWKLLYWRFTLESAKDVIWTSLGGFNLIHIKVRKQGMILKLSNSIKKLQWPAGGEAQKAQVGPHISPTRQSMCPLAGHWCHIPQCPSSMAWDGLCTLGDLFVNQGMPLWVHRFVLLMQRNCPVCLEQGPLQDTGFVLSRNKVNCVVAFCVIFLHVTKGNQWAFAAFQDFMLIFHCYQYFYFFFRKGNYINYHEVTNPQSCNHCRHNASYLQNMNNLVHLFTWSFELLLNSFLEPLPNQEIEFRSMNGKGFWQQRCNASFLVLSNLVMCIPLVYFEFQ